jgi:hypothetical protein
MIAQHIMTWSKRVVQVSKKNLMEIVKKLMLHMDKAEGSQYRDELLVKTIEICSQSNYQHVTNFEWFVRLFFLSIALILSVFAE